MKNLLIGLSFLTLTLNAYALNGEKIFEKHSTAILKLNAITPTGESIDLGTGFFIEENGLIFTNQHVVQAFRDVDTNKNNIWGGSTINGNQYDIQFVKEHDFADVALLRRVDKLKKGDSYLNLSKAPAKTGADIFLIGNPDNQNFRITNGIISYMGPMAGEGTQNLQYTAATLPGSSGSPLINSNGDVIGIHSNGYKEKLVLGVDTENKKYKWETIKEQGYNAGWDKIYLEEMLTNIPSNNAVSSNNAIPSNNAVSSNNAVFEEQPKDVNNSKISNPVKSENDLASLIRELKAYTPPEERKLGSL